MALTLTVPDEGATSASDVETHPARLEEQLAQLPLLNAPDSRRSVYKLLSSLNRSEIDDERRLTLLELYRVPVDKICRELQRQYLGQALPIMRGSSVQSAYRCAIVSCVHATGVCCADTRIIGKLARGAALSTI